MLIVSDFVHDLSKPALIATATLLTIRMDMLLLQCVL